MHYFGYIQVDYDHLCKLFDFQKNLFFFPFSFFENKSLSIINHIKSSIFFNIQDNVLNIFLKTWKYVYLQFVLAQRISVTDKGNSDIRT